MVQYTSIVGKPSTHVPADFWLAHEYCFTLHDAMTELLKAGERSNLFTSSVPFKDDADRQLLEQSDDIFAWLDATRRHDEREALLVTLVFPAILSDMLHCIHEALQASRKGKLVVAYMLLRKPLQENLYVLEAIVANRAEFADRLTNSPISLDGKAAGGMEAHTQRIANVARIIAAGSRFDPAYLAQLRYDKKADDSFDGVCNKAMHLFTSHPAIKTEKMNINFIFSGPDQFWTQWSYLYARLPYLLTYTHSVVEHVCAAFGRTDPIYEAYLEKRLGAFQVLWRDTLSDFYNNTALLHFGRETAERLNTLCIAAGYPAPTSRDLHRMADEGGYPGESWLRIRLRRLYFSFSARVNS